MPLATTFQVIVAKEGDGDKDGAGEFDEVGDFVGVFEGVGVGEWELRVEAGVAVGVATVTVRSLTPRPQPNNVKLINKTIEIKNMNNNRFLFFILSPILLLYSGKGYTDQLS